MRSEMVGRPGALIEPRAHRNRPDAAVLVNVLTHHIGRMRPRASIVSIVDWIACDLGRIEVLTNVGDAILLSKGFRFGLKTAIFRDPCPTLRRQSGYSSPAKILYAVMTSLLKDSLDPFHRLDLPVIQG